MSSLESEYIVDARYPSTKGFLNALSSIRPPKAQDCLVHFNSEGLTLKWEHPSKAMQSGIFIGHALFTAYNIQQETSFSLPFMTLFNTLQVFAPGELGDLVLRYPGPESELMLESTEPELPTSNLVDGLQQSINQPPPPSAPTASIYARIRTAEEIPIYDILDHFDDPCSYFIGPGSLIKEAIDDMEWVTGGNAGGGAGGGGTSSDKGAVGITLMRDPAGLKFSSRKQNLSLEVTFPNDKLSAISVVGHEVHWEYNFTLLRAIFANLNPSRGQMADSSSTSSTTAGVLSKVAIDQQGKMKVTHMLRVTGSGEEYSGDLASHPLAAGGELQHHHHQQQQYAPVQQRLVVAQFALLSKIDDEEEEDGGVTLDTAAEPSEDQGHRF
ncbi:hypothetical protein NADE_007277 [Nannochloris sp. 'desiccata']|nr:hypothetical protein NADE_007277 [Chlorella desiccata (nom. nud.)]